MKPSISNYQALLAMLISKQTWDTRAWRVGTIGGGISATCFALSYNPRIMAKQNAALPHGHNLAGIVFGALSLLLFPAVLSGIARRRTFLWGLLLLLLFLGGTEREQTIDYGWQRLERYYSTALITVGISWLISSGPVSLIRWLRVRAAQRRQAALASYEAVREAAVVPQEGVWPPPPNPS